MPIIIIGIVIILIVIFMYLTHPVNYEPTSHYEAIGTRPTKVIHNHKAQKKLVVKKPTIKKHL